jgi:hypothetical protein
VAGIAGGFIVSLPSGVEVMYVVSDEGNDLQLGQKYVSELNLGTSFKVPPLR